MAMHSAPNRAGELEIVMIGAWYARRGQHAAAHRHDGWKITFYRTGRITSIVDGVATEVVPGTVQVMPPRAAHAEVARTAYSNYYLLVPASIDRSWPAVCHGEPAAEVGRYLAALLRETSSPDDHGPTAIPALLHLIDITLQRAGRPVAREAGHATVRAAEIFFEEHYPRPLAMAEVADHVGVSPSTLRLHFAAAIGRSPGAVLRSVRLRHALTLLRSSDLPLAAVADRCGLHSASHLSREVKQEVGRAPGAWRREIAG